MAALERLPPGAARCRLLDRIGTPGPLLTQFVDDGMGVLSSLRGVRGLGEAMGEFSHQWAHAFAGGKKGPWVMAINTVPPQLGWVGPSGGPLG